MSSVTYSGIIPVQSAYTWLDPVYAYCGDSTANTAPMGTDICTNNYLD